MVTETAIPSLAHHHTFPSPTGKTRAWSSRPHPSSRSALLATASSDKSVQIWDLRDFKLVSNINGGHKRSVRCVGWKDWGFKSRSSAEVNGTDDDGETQRQHVDKPVTLATGSFDANVGVWIYEPHADKKMTSAVDELDMTNPPDGFSNADERDDNGEEEEEDWHFTTLLTGPDSEIKDLQFSPPHYGANLLATCSRDKSVWIWEEVEDDNEWETIAVLSEHTGDVKCVGWCSGAAVEMNEGGRQEEIVVGSREVLATGSYDDTIRLWRDVEEEGDWTCVAVLDGHKGTVWDLCWEGYLNRSTFDPETDVREWEPRILSCSDDMTLRIWNRELSETEKDKKKARLLQNGSSGPRQDRLPSSIRINTTMEKWTEESALPQVHVRSVYAVDWSRKTGLVVSCGGDGTIAVYHEVLDEESPASQREDAVMSDSAANGTSGARKRTKWVVVALIEAAHDEYEVNHVCWAVRRDKEARWPDEEAIVSTGDDGDVRIWILPEGIVGSS